MLAGDPYIADDRELQQESRRAMQLLARFNETLGWNPASQRPILEKLLGALGEASEIRPPLYCDYGHRIRIGARCFVNFGLCPLDVAEITIGDDVQVGPNVQLLTPTHPVDADLRRARWEAAKPISIGDNVWLGGGAIVLPGVSVGANTVVGAGSVVTKSLPPGVVAVGNPARILRRL